MPKMRHLTKPTIRLAAPARRLIAKQPYAGARGGAPCLDLNMVNGVATSRDEAWFQEAAEDQDCLFCTMPSAGGFDDPAIYCGCDSAPQKIYMYTLKHLKRNPHLHQRLAPAMEAWSKATTDARQYIDEEVFEREGVRAARKRWRALQTFVASRRVVLYWQETTHTALCAPGGAGRVADLTDYAADGFA